MPQIRSNTWLFSRWTALVCACAAYFVAVVERTSMAVSGLAASERFEVSAAQLSLLGMLQLMVYAAMQIPVGLLLDRFGSRALIVTGTATMAAGQLLVALAPGFSQAVGGRALVGLGDAMIFISVIRLTGERFSARQAPMMAQVVGAAGALGQICTTVPYVQILLSWGWGPSFVTVAILSALISVAAFIWLRQRPSSPVQNTVRINLKTALGSVISTARRRGTLAAFCAHYSTQAYSTVFGLFWGYPFMVEGMGYSAGLASSLLLVNVLTTLLLSPVFGLIMRRFPNALRPLLLLAIGTNTSAWLLLILYPAVIPAALMILVMVGIGVGYPASMLSFEVARRTNPPQRWGTANGIVNTGGFVSSFIGIFLIGLTLDLVNRFSNGSAETLYRQGNFQIAFIVQLLVTGAGALALAWLLLSRRRHLLLNVG